MIKMQLTISEIAGAFEAVAFELELKAAMVTKEGYCENFYTKKSSINQLIPCQVIEFLRHSKELLYFHSMSEKTHNFLTKATLAVIERKYTEPTLEQMFEEISALNINDQFKVGIQDRKVDEVLFKQDWVELSIKFLDSQPKR